eukprot:TRINITY_DN165_c0_g1_i1.p1 TRINITY_DN165_c0_g1~~TRINITY_DN165_c0_g1_i1.p1  ORF type:complete len:286 (-),score=71.88 TRINITY_DN165_c0_g1_i1:35-892(-)
MFVCTRFASPVKLVSVALQFKKKVNQKFEDEFVSACQPSYGPWFSFKSNNNHNFHVCTGEASMLNGGLWLLENDLTVNANPVESGVLKIPRPGHSIWSGTRFSFKNSKKLQTLLADGSSFLRELSKIEFGNPLLDYVARNPNEEDLCEPDNPNDDNEEDLCEPDNPNDDNEEDLCEPEENKVDLSVVLGKEKSSEDRISDLHLSFLNGLVDNLVDYEVIYAEFDHFENYLEIIWDEITVTVSKDIIRLIGSDPANKDRRKILLKEQLKESNTGTITSKIIDQLSK